HHPYRHKEDSTKQIFDRLDEVLDSFSLRRFSDNRTHDERPKLSREASMSCEHDHTQAQTDGEDEQCLSVEQCSCPPEQRWQQKDPTQEPERQEEDKLDDSVHDLHALKFLSHGDGGEQHHEENDDDVFHDKDSENNSGVLPGFHSKFIKCPNDDRRGRTREHPTQEQAIHGRPAHKSSRVVS